MFRFINSNIFIFVGFIFFLACTTIPVREEPPLNVVNRVDISRYLGRWYEIARYPIWFLSRKPTMGKLKYSKLVESLAKRNFDIGLLKVTPQT